MKNLKESDIYNLKDNINNGTTIFQNNTFYSDKGTRMSAAPNWQGMNMGASDFNSKPKQSNKDYANMRLNRQIGQMFDHQEKQSKLRRKKEKQKKFYRLLKLASGKVVYDRAKALFITHRPTVTYKSLKKYIKAEMSNIEQGPVSLPIYEERKKICGECPHRKYVDGYKDPLGFCTKCGCGANPRAQLTVKLKLPATSCPLDKWGESTGIYEGFWGRIRYILSRNKKGQDNG